jgi:hypothetical protein
MRILILFLSLTILFSCKKKEEDLDPIKPSYDLKIVYKSEDPTGMTVWCTTTNKFFFNEHKATSDYTFTQTIQAGQNLQASITSPSGYWKTMIVIFKSDTLYNVKSHSDHACNINL